MGTIGTNARRATKIILQQWWKQGNKFPKFTHCCKIIFWIKTAHNLLLLTYRSSKDKEKDNQLKSLNHCADWGRSTTDIYDFSTKVCNSILILLNLWHGTTVLSCCWCLLCSIWIGILQAHRITSVALHHRVFRGIVKSLGKHYGKVYRKF